MIHMSCDNCGGRTTQFIETGGGAYCHNCGQPIKPNKPSKVKERSLKLNKIMNKMKRWKTKNHI